MANIPPFKYQHPFPLGEDKTEYYLLTKDYVSVGEFEGVPVLKVAKEGLTAMANAAFRDGSLSPVLSGAVPDSIYALVSRAARENEATLDAAFSLDYGYAYTKFAELNMIKSLGEEEKKELFETMWSKTEKYLGMYKR